MKHNLPGEDDLERLFRDAERRPEPPDEVRERVRARVFEVWGEEVARRGRRRYIGLAAAASAVLAVGLVVAMQLYRTPAAAPAPVGTVTLAHGAYEVGAATPNLHDGEVVRTGAGGFVQVVLAGGAAVRFDAQTEVAFGDGRMALRTGRVYVDAGPAAASVLVATRFGEITDIGTRFAVDVRGDALTVAVREGEVRIASAGQVIRGAAGDGFGDIVKLDDRARASVTRVSTTDPMWDWILAGAPRLDLEVATVYEFLELVARETGRELVWARDVVEVEARGARWNSGGIIEIGRDLNIDVLLAGARFRLLPDASHRMVVDTIR